VLVKVDDTRWVNPEHVGTVELTFNGVHKRYTLELGMVSGDSMFINAEEQEPLLEIAELLAEAREC
jgi:hypothetical protein